MKYLKSKLEDTEIITWGIKKDKLIIAIHGLNSEKDNLFIKLVFPKAFVRGYQIISFDLPMHGVNKNKFTYDNCFKLLNKIYDKYANEYKEIYLLSFDIGCFLSLLCYEKKTFKKCLFISPILDINYFKEKVKRNDRVFNYLKNFKELDNINWLNNTYLLYGFKDTLQSYNIIESFTNKFTFQCYFSNNANHFFDTQESINDYIDFISLLL